MFLVHNQKGCVHGNLLKEMKSDSTLQDCLCIAKLMEGTVHVEKLGQNFLGNVEKHDQNVDAANHGRQQSKKHNGQNSDSKVIVIAEEVASITKVVRNVVIVELITHLISVQHMGKTVSSARRKDISVLTVILARIANSMDIHPQEDLDIHMKWNKMTMVMIEPG